MNLEPIDYQYVLETPDEGFSPERNKEVIETSIKEYERERARRQSEYMDKMGEVLDAVSDYAIYRLNKGTKTPDDYFGRQVMTRLAGERILDKLRYAHSAGEKKFVLL